jgi:hypothetical protein
LFFPSISSSATVGDHLNPIALAKANPLLIVYCSVSFHASLGMQSCGRQWPLVVAIKVIIGKNCDRQAAAADEPGQALSGRAFPPRFPAPVEKT